MNSPAANIRTDSGSSKWSRSPFGGHTPSDAYHREDIARREIDRIFLKEWLCVAREEELAAPGDHLPLYLFGESIILTRNLGGTVHAFLNMCPHRGAEFACTKGNAKALVCPYHAWTFNLDGSLRGAARTGSLGPAIKDIKLSALKVAKWRGWIFVNFDPESRPFDDMIGQWEQELWYYRTERCRLAFKLERRFKCNWKYVNENVMDYYHAGTVHAATFGKQFDFSSGELPLKQMADGGLSLQFDTRLRRNDPPFFPVLPWLEDRPEFGAAKAAMFPNLNLFVNTDSLRTSTFWPKGPAEMQLNLYFMLPEEYFELPDFDERLDRYRTLTRQIGDEDMEVMESLQRTSQSRFLRPGPVVDLEVPVRLMQDHYYTVMGL